MLVCVSVVRALMFSFVLLSVYVVLLIVCGAGWLLELLFHGYALPQSVFVGFGLLVFGMFVVCLLRGGLFCFVVC